MEPLFRHRIFASTDVHESSQFASQIWERNRTTLTRGTYGLRWNDVAIDKVSLAYIEHDCDVDLKAEGPLSDHFRFFIHAGGSLDHRVKGRQFLSHEDNTVAHSPGMDLHLLLGPSRFLLVSLDGASVRHAMEQRFRHLPAYSNWLDVLPQSANLRALRSMTLWLVNEIDTPGSPLADAGKPRLHAERLLLSLFVECLAEAAPARSQAHEQISCVQVRRAEDWIEAHLMETIGVEEVATAIGVCVRSLQMSFKRVRGCSPHEFITRRRLELARQMLLAASGATTVTGIAMSMGFFELGRFSQRYKQYFGETPSMTLMKTRS